MRKHDESGYYFAPTDLVNFLGCSHCTVLDLRALSEPLEPDEPSEGDKLLQQKGQEHEAAYLKNLKTDGKQVAEIPADIPLTDRSQLTTEAMQQGADVIYQATLLGKTWGGYADFLVKTDRPSKFGSYSYEATDTKLARQAQVKHLVQLGVYSGLLTGQQGTARAPGARGARGRHTCQFFGGRLRVLRPSCHAAAGNLLHGAAGRLLSRTLLPLHTLPLAGNVLRAMAAG